MGICTEFDSVVYVCDAQANSLMVCTEVKQCSLFLNAMGSLYNAFSVHNKGSTYTVKRPDAVSYTHLTLPTNREV